jgi:hypothetical protein
MRSPIQTSLNSLKVSLHHFFSLFGFDIVRINEHQSDLPITGTLPPPDAYFSIGHSQDYFIHEGYRHRSKASYYDDTANTDAWQREVYRFAREVFNQQKLGSVCDIGCGSGYKLVKYFGDCDTVGFDVPKTCMWLRRKYPHRTWMELDFNSAPPVQQDLVIAADVIEHLLEPDLLLSYIEKLKPKFVVLSTPDRNLLRAGTHNGPPRNLTHMREWGFAEFQAYIGSRFQILEHFISNNTQATQCILCSPLRTK